MTARPPPPAPSPALLAAVARMRPVATRRPRREALRIVAAALAATALLLAALPPAATAPAATAPAATAPALLWAAGAIAALFAARVVAAVVPPAHAVLPRPARPWLKNLAAIAAIVALMLQAHPAPAEAATQHPLSLWPCLVRGLVAAALPLAIAVAVLRRLVADPAVRRELTGAVVALAGLVLLVSCGNGGRAHILGVHGGLLLGAPLLAELVMTAARGRAAAR